MINETIAHYRITSKLGQGGMGEVYRATDTKLDRDVAIKILPESFAGDRDRIARFKREAKVLATLNHPNIATIYGIEKSGDTHALVMELIKGETMGERLKREPMTVEEALDCCKQIAEALEAAHEKGIIHRDLKPDNVKISSDGHVKVLDFGLAKEVVDSAASEDQAESPTLTHMTTVPGELLGTAPYMSPEQARARPVDKRSDIWSFGCVLYECLTGKPMFQGEDVTETLATIIKGEPDWAALPSDTPPTIELLLRKCLNKDRKRRLRDIGDARIDLEQALGDPTSSIIRLSDQALQQTTKQRGIKPSLAIGAVALGVLSAVALTWYLKPVASPVPPVTKRSDILVGGSAPFTVTQSNNAFALSRDGKTLVYNVNDQGQGLIRRDLVTGEESRIPGAADPLEGYPFISWDGSRIGCVFGSELVTLPIAGGTPRNLGVSSISYESFAGADWGESGDIVFAPARRQSLKLVSEEGGNPRELTQLEGDFIHAFPQFLPDGDHVLFTAVSIESGTAVGRAEIVNLSTGQRQALGIENCEFTRYCSSGHLLYAVENEVFAVAFDPERLAVSGSAKRVLEGVASNSLRAQFDVAEDGTLVYLPVSNGTGGVKTLMWLDSTGQMQSFTEKGGDWESFDLSPNERRVALEIDNDIWILDKLGEDFEQIRPLVTDDSVDGRPLWSPDGEFVYFNSDREDRQAIWKKRADFSQAPAALVCEIESIAVFPTSISDNHLLLTVLDREGDLDVWRLDLSEENAVPQPLVSESYNEMVAVISPDERWMAYMANEKGPKPDVYVKSIDGSGGARLVSDNGGLYPRWSRSGDELFYHWPPTLFSVSVSEQEGQLALSKPEALFSSQQLYESEWEVSQDGQRFLILVDARDVDSEDLVSTEPIHLRMVSNWFTELNALVPVDGN